MRTTKLARRVYLAGLLAGGCCILIAAILMAHLGIVDGRAAHKAALSRLGEFEVYSLEGARRRIGDLLNGHPTAVAFVSPTCGHCQAELSVLDRLSANIPGDAGLLVIADPTGRSARDLRQFRSEHAAVPVYFDRDRVRRSLRFQVVPVILFIDRRGAVREVLTGESSAASLVSAFRKASQS